MSAYLSSNDCLNSLVTYWEFRSDQGANNARDQLARAFAWFYDSHGKKCFSYSHGVDQTTKALEDYGTAANAVFHILLEENVKSLKARYPGSEEMWEQAEDYRFRRSSTTLSWCMNVRTGQGNLVGMLRGYRYQSCEHDTWEQSTAYQILEQIKEYLLNDLERRDCGTNYEWADYTEIPSAGGPIQLSKIGA